MSKEKVKVEKLISLYDKKNIRFWELDEQIKKLKEERDSLGEQVILLDEMFTELGIIIDIE